MNGRLVYTAEEVAEMLGITPNALLKHSRKGPGLSCRAKTCRDTRKTSSG